MKGLKKIALCSAVALAPFAANADMKALNDSDMGSVTGQAGVTIDIDNTNVTIGEIAYKDQGFIALSGVSLGGGTDLRPGATQGALDDIQLTIDVVGDGNEDLGVTNLATQYLRDNAAVTIVEDNADPLTTLNSNDVTLGDGDLVIALRSQSGTPVDFSMGIEQVALASSEGEIGNLRANGAGTVLISNLNMTGYIGPVDIVVDGTANEMNINAFFTAGGSLEMPFIGTSMDFELHNRRGNVQVTAAGGLIGFAHAQVEVGIAEEYIGTDDALSVKVTDFSGDLDLKNINTGGPDNIGDLYITDLAVNADMVIYGH